MNTCNTFKSLLLEDLKSGLEVLLGPAGAVSATPFLQLFQ
jgi:hypothetical protein